MPTPGGLGTTVARPGSLNPNSSTKSEVRLPDVIGIGPPRTGSTWLYEVLNGHVQMPYGVKDTHFFDRFHDLGLDWYARHFRFATAGLPIVEICPGCFFKPNRPEWINAEVPSCRVIATMRDPVDRLYSVYKLQRHFAETRMGSFDEVLKRRPEFGNGNRYASYLRKWFDTLGRENVLVTMYDELHSDPQTYLNRVTDFIGIERIALSERPKIADDVNSFARAPRQRRLARRATRLMYWLRSRQAYGTVDLLERAGVWDFCHGRGEPFGRLTAEQDERLRERYRPEVEALEELIGIDLSSWKKPRTARDTGNAAAAPVAVSANG